MALINSPYLPLNVHDFLTDEKLADCTAATNGVYIRLMCILHKSPTYGKLLLKEQYRQNKDMLTNFGLMLCKRMPYSMSEIYDGLVELSDNGIVFVEEDYLVQPRMAKEGELSEKRSLAGSRGGKKTSEICLSKIPSKESSKIQANTQNINNQHVETSLFQDIEEEDLGKKKRVDKKKSVCIFNLVEALTSIGVDKNLADEWVRVRKAKKLVNTETAFERTKNEIAKSGWSANDCIRLCVERSWGGFKAEWVSHETPFRTETATTTNNTQSSEDWQL